MNATTKELAIGSTMAAVMLLVAAIAKASGVAPADFSQRAMLVLTGGYLARVGNALPKTRLPLERAMACSPAGLAMRRFVGWTWALAGVVVVAGACLLPIDVANTVTLGSLLCAITVTTIRWTTHLRTPRETS